MFDALMDLAHSASPELRCGGTPPTPLAPLVLCTAGAAGLLGLGALAALRGDVLVVAPVSIALFALLRTARHWDARRRLRAEADAWILRVYENRANSREQPVSAAGILTVQRLITEPGSVLYAPPRVDGRPHHTRAVLGAILHHLEVRS